jgi:hypothetical protein
LQLPHRDREERLAEVAAKARTLDREDGPVARELALRAGQVESTQEKSRASDCAVPSGECSISRKAQAPALPGHPAFAETRAYADVGIGSGASCF